MMSDYFGKSRQIVLIDADSFSVQVYLKDHSELEGLPCAVVLRTGRIISANYEAKQFDVSRNITADEAKRICPQINLIEMDYKYGKSYDMKEKKASEALHDVIRGFAERYGNMTVEKASIDEFYIDMTQECQRMSQNCVCYSFRSLNRMKTRVETGAGKRFLSEIDSMKDSPFTYCAVLANKLVREIRQKAGYGTSAGISYNKLLAKTVCGLNKPNKISIINSSSGIKRIFDDLNLRDLHGFGGSFGERVVEELNIETVAELREFSKNDFSSYDFDEDECQKLWEVARGIDESPVIPKIMNKSVSSGRTYPKGLINDDDIEESIELECKSLVEKLGHDKKRNNRKAGHIRVEIFLRSMELKPDIKFWIDITSIGYKWKDIYDDIADEVFDRMDRRRHRKIFETKFTATNFEQL